MATIKLKVIGGNNRIPLQTGGLVSNGDYNITCEPSSASAVLESGLGKTYLSISNAPSEDFYLTIEGEITSFKLNGSGAWSSIDTIKEIHILNNSSLPLLDEADMGPTIPNIIPLNIDNLELFRYDFLDSLPYSAEDFKMLLDFINTKDTCQIQVKGLLGNIDLSEFSGLNEESVNYILNNVKKYDNSAIITFNSSCPGYLSLYTNDTSYVNATENYYSISPKVTQVRTATCKVERYFDGIINNDMTVISKENVNSWPPIYDDVQIPGYEVTRVENYPFIVSIDESKNIIKIYYTKIPPNTPFKVVYTDSLEKYNALLDPDPNTMYIVGEENNEMIIFNNQVVSNKGIKLERL